MEDHIIQLKNYIHEQLQAGFTPEVIAQHLRTANWSDADVQTGLRLAQAEQAQHSQHPNTPPMDHKPEASQPLTVSASGTNLLDTTGENAYLSNPFLSNLRGLALIVVHNPQSTLLLPVAVIVAYLGVIFALILLLIIVAGLHFVIGISGIFNIFTILAGFGIFVGGLGAMMLLTAAASAISAASVHGQTINLREALAQARQKFWPYVGLRLLISLMVIIGLVLFIMPGLIINARLNLAFIVLFSENLGMRAAMRRSMKLTKGHLLEMLGATLGMGVFNSIVGLLLVPLTNAPAVGRYRDLVAAETNGAPKTRVHWLNYVIAIIMPIIIAVAIAGMLVGSHNAPANKVVCSGCCSDKYTSLQQAAHGSACFPSNLDPYTQ